MLLSIIIPVYNVEKYVEKCIRSCAEQNIPLSEYEIIVVNDGATDSSASIVSVLVQEFSNIRVLNQQNQGLSMARNNGLHEALGVYVWFVDSDDWIEPNCLQRIFSLLDQSLDILQLQYRLTYDDTSLNKDVRPTQIEGVQSGKDVFLAGGLPAPAQFCIYRKSFLEDNKIYFVPGIYHEDSEFKPRATYLANRIASDSKISYNYYQRMQGSIMSSFSFKRAQDIFFVCNSLFEFARGLDLDYRKQFYNHISLNLNSLFFETRKLPIELQCEVHQLLKNNRHLIACMCKTTSLKYKIEGFCFGLSVSLGFKLHQFFR